MQVVLRRAFDQQTAYESLKKNASHKAMKLWQES